MSSNEPNPPEESSTGIFSEWTPAQMAALRIGLIMISTSVAMALMAPKLAWPMPVKYLIWAASAIVWAWGMYWMWVHPHNDQAYAPESEPMLEQPKDAT